MFRKMRRFKQELSPEDTREVLLRGTAGVLGVSGDDGYPYTVPVSYVYADGCIYFHSAKSGHKIDAIKNSDKVSFCVIDKDQIVPEKCTTYFRSVIAFGRARFLEGEEKEKAFLLLAEKYSADFPDAIKEEMKGAPNAEMIEIRIEHLTGKEAIELVRARG